MYGCFCIRAARPVGLGRPTHFLPACWHEDLAINTRPIAEVKPDDDGASGGIGMTVGVGAADGFGAASVDLKSGTDVLRGMATPGDRQIGGEAVLVERIGDNRA